MSAVPLEHEFWTSPLIPGDIPLCRYMFQHQGKKILCSQVESHEWHYITHCTDCRDSGIIWTLPYHEWLKRHTERPEACPTCEEGQLMKEFL